jgi:hypothetical protein
MTRYAWLAMFAVLIAGCNSGPSQTIENTVGGPNVVSSTKTAMAKATASLALGWGKKGQAGQLAIADVVSYGGPKPVITAPADWKLIRDDSTATTRQSIYWHTLTATDVSPATWIFSAPVDAQGAIVLLDTVAAGEPIDMTSGNTGSGGTLTAKSVATTADGDLILGFFATDFHLPGLAASEPADASALVDQEAAPAEFWIVASYQNQQGATEDMVGNAAQLFNWTAAQVTVKKGAASSATP